MTGIRKKNIYIYFQMDDSQIILKLSMTIRRILSRLDLAYRITNTGCKATPVALLTKLLPVT